MSTYKYFDKPGLLAAAKLAKRRKYGRQIPLKEVKGLGDFSFPIMLSTVIENGGKPFIRAMVAIGNPFELDTREVGLDIDAKVFESLPEFEYDEKEGLFGSSV